MDTFSNELTVMANTIVEAEGLKKVTRQDNSEVKRVELHMHTQMSQMDAMTSAKDLIKRAMKWGMKSIAITDHGVVQAFPEAHKLLGYDNPDMKIIYGVEAYLAPDKNPVVANGKGQSIDTTTAEISPAPHMPCAITRWNMSCPANSGSIWAGFTSPETAANSWMSSAVSERNT